MFVSYYTAKLRVLKQAAKLVEKRADIKRKRTYFSTFIKK